MQNIGDKVDNTPGASGELTAAEFNDHKNEIQEPVTTTGQTLSNLKTPDQLSRSQFIYGAASQSVTDAAPSANVIELTPLTGAGGLVVPDAYSQMEGLILEFDRSTPNTSNTVTVNFGQTSGTLLGAKSLKLLDGSSPGIGQVQGRLRIQFDVGSDYWKIVTTLSIEVPVENDIINGMFDIWQRGTTFTGVADGDYTADRFLYNKNGTMVHDVLQSSDTPDEGYNFSSQIDCTTAQGSIGASNYITYSQKIEGYNFKKLVNSYCTLGFWVKSSKTGTHCVSFRNSGSDRSYVVEYNVDAIDTWEYKTITILFDETAGTWDYTNGTGITVTWTLAAGTTFQTTQGVWQTGNYMATAGQVNLCDSVANNFRITGITFNKGLSPVDNSYYNIENETGKCQSYAYYVENAGATTPITMISVRTATVAEGVITFPVKMRANPVINTNAGSGINYIGVAEGGTDWTNMVPSIIKASKDKALLSIANAGASMTVGRGGRSTYNNALAFVGFEAEL